MDKTQLRKQIREQKRAMTPEQVEQKSRLLGQKFAASEAYQNAKTIYGYLPYNQEVRTVPMLLQAIQDGKRVAVPRVCGEEMIFFYMTDFDRVEKSNYGIPEPLGDEPVADDPTALVLMPGLAFDKAGYRVGYGGGYYDRFLELEPDHPTVALCFDVQILDCLEPDPFDIPADFLLWA